MFRRKCLEEYDRIKHGCLCFDELMDSPGGIVVKIMEVKV